MSLEPPRPKLPPLNALRAFEAAARLGSFTAAGEELHVTPGAIAQHVKALEAWVAGELFRRNARGVELSDLGQSVLPAFTEAFDRMGEAVHSLFAQATPDQVRIAALPSIAQLWVSPRLPVVRATMPDVQISLIALEQRPNLRRDLFDLSLFFEADGTASNPQTIDICEDEIFPVCAPDLAKRLNEPADLRGAILLRDSQWSNDWPRWFSYAAPGFAIDDTGSVFSLYSLAVEEARNGGGVLIGHAPLVHQFLEEGSLIAPFSERLASGQKLRMFLHAGSEARVQVKQVADLLSA